MLKNMFAKTEIQVAIITVIGVFLTVIGSIVVVNLTNNGQIELQRIEDVREMKRTYYNQLTESFTKKLMYIGKPDSIEKVEAEMRFLEEANRLPLYASQEMVEFIEQMKNPEIARNTSTKEFYIIMRKDLCSNNFDEFNNLNEIGIGIPDKVIITNSQGEKNIQP